ncbi:MAG TPA: Gfo/Idh/MocA family oxidoreductase, partial [Thermoproteales archaeon]|nr:Gfo/Idh/MocA family oxidoreductase [Thermoproteales archaeon]
MLNMYKIGIVGSDNSHAITFSQMLNDPLHKYHVDGMRVLYLYGLNDERNREVAEKGRILHIVGEPEEMIGKVDCVFIEFRDGALHYKYAKPFLEEGIPVFVDKPLAATVEDAEKIVKLALDNHTLLTSFSVLRFSKKVQAIASEEKPVTLTITGPGDPDSQYSGLIFYGIHVAEILEEIVSPRSWEVYAIRKGKTVEALINIENGPIANIKISNEIPYNFTIHYLGKNKIIYHKIEDYMFSYRKGLLTVK